MLHAPVTYLGRNGDEAFLLFIALFSYGISGQDPRRGDTIGWHFANVLSVQLLESGGNLEAFWCLHPQFELWAQGVRWDPAVQHNLISDRCTKAKHDGMILRMSSQL